MTYTVKLSVPWKPCKNPWQIKNHGELPQQKKQIVDFIDYHNISDVIYVTNTDNLDQHDMHVLTINHSYYSLDQLSKLVKCLADHSGKYIWISINKFLIYSTQENKFSLECPDWDLRLLNFVAEQIPEWTTIKKVFRDDDFGQLGNFQYPVTALVAQRS
jgi:hypothetical protein